MNPVFSALVPAMQVVWGNWWTSTDDTWVGEYDDDTWDD
jgi:hypothetical protein